MLWFSRRETIHIIGQERALEAVDFGVGMLQSRFNLFVIGAEGSGRYSVIKSFINKKAAEEETPEDWCYLHNFKHPHRPLAVAFPAGHSLVFKREMHDLVDKLKSTIPTVFEGDDYRARSKVVHDKLQHKVEKLYHSVEERAKADNIAVIKSEQGAMFAPMDNDGRPIETKEFLRKPEPERKQIEKKIEKYQTELQQASHQVSILKREAEELGRKLKKETAQLAVSHLINTLKKKYREREDLLAYLDNVEEEITESVDDFLYRPESQSDNFLALVAASTPSFEQYEVNVLISHENGGAPVVYEDLPTYQNLHGRIEHKARMGVLSTNFTLIKPGSLHQANGGYLILDARRLLMQPFVYEGLKRALRSEQIRIEPVECLLGLMSTVTLEPEPIVLETKVVLIGDPLIYYLLKYYDPEFQALFKV